MARSIIMLPQVTETEYTAATAVAAPVTPTNLAATSGSGQITLNWDFQFNQLGWEIYKSTSSPVTTSDTKIELVANKSQYTDTDVVNGTTYYYAIRIKSTSGWSSLSSEVSVTPITWANATSLAFDTGDYFTISGTDWDYDLSSESFTVSLWGKFGSGGRDIVGNWTPDTDGWRIIRSGGQIYTRHAAASTTYWTRSSSISNSTWYHIVSVWDASSSTAKIYVNSVDDTAILASGDPGAPDYSSATPYIGKGNVGDYNGSLAQMTLWNIALSPSQVASLYNSGSPVNPVTMSFAANLSHVYLFGDTPGDETNMADAIGTAEATGTNVTADDYTSDVP